MRPSPKADNSRGIISNKKLETYVVFQYNPVDITDSIPVNWEEDYHPGRGSPAPIIPGKRLADKVI